jgi:hypothetical protein
MRRSPAVSGYLRMSAFVPRLTPFALGLFFVAASPLATAQVTLNLTSPQQPTPCVVTTDANGLTLAPTGTALQATVVTYGTGCGSGSSAFSAQLTVPQTTVALTPVNVVWSAAQTATQCVYAGAAPVGATLTGWPFGSSACQDASCSGSHTTPVTPSAAGNYYLSVVCTNASGLATGVLTASPPPTPPTPDHFLLTVPTNAVINRPFAISWENVYGATSCIGSASLPSSGWTDSTFSPTPPRNVTALQTGTYTFALACSNDYGTITSQSATVTVSPGAGACNDPAGLTRQLTGNIAYVYTTGIRVGGDLTMYDNIWGHDSSSDTLVPWPGRSPSMPIITMSRNQYIAAQFTVPAGVRQTLLGSITRTTYNYGIDMTAAISRTCGDFNPTNPRCLSAIPTGNFPYWQTSATGNQCPVTDGVYYLNIKATNPAQVSGTCPNASSPTCPMGTSNQFGG